MYFAEEIAVIGIVIGILLILTAYNLTKHPAGVNSAVRFDERNVNAQCSFRCNKQMSGNLAEYGYHLKRKIGEEAFEELAKIRQNKVKWTIPDLERLIKIYKEKSSQ